MNWETTGQLALMAAVIAAQLPALRQQWLEDRAGSIKSMRLLAYYFVYIAVGFGVLLTVIRNGGRPDTEFVGAMAFVFGWILLGTSWLIKVVPRYRQVPQWLLQPVGPLDAAAFLLLALALFAHFL